MTFTLTGFSFSLRIFQIRPLLLSLMLTSLLRPFYDSLKNRKEKNSFRVHNLLNVLHRMMGYITRNILLSYCPTSNLFIALHTWSGLSMNPGNLLIISKIKGKSSGRISWIWRTSSGTAKCATVSLNSLVWYVFWIQTSWLNVHLSR